MERRTSTRRPLAALVAATLVLSLGCTDLVPFAAGDGTAVAIIVGDEGRARLAPLDGTTDVLADVEPSSTVYLGTLEVPYRTLSPYVDGEPAAIDLVEPRAAGARPLPLIALLDADRRALEALPGELVTTHLPALSDNRCAASAGCAAELPTESVGILRVCSQPCPAIAPPAPPAAVVPPSPPDRATSRAPEGCGMLRVNVATATAGLVLARCGAPPPSPPPDCADGERATADGACASLAACTEGFPPGLDDRRTWFVDTTALTEGDGTRARPARRVDVATLPAALDTIAARGALTLGELPTRALTVMGPCPRALRVSGELVATAPLTLAGLRFDGTLEVRGARARLSGVDWPMPRVAALLARDGAELDLADVALHAPTSTSAGARLATVLEARLSATRLSIASGSQDANVLLVSGGSAAFDALALDGVELRATRGATVTIESARAWAADARPLARVDRAALHVRGAVLSGRGAPTALFVASAGRLTLADLAVRALGAIVFARDADVDASDVAATLGPGSVAAAFRIVGGALALTRVDLVLEGLAGIFAELAAIRAQNLIVEHQALDDRGLQLSSGTSSVARVAVFGLGRYGALLYGGRHAWSDVHVALMSTANPRVEPTDRHSTGLFLADVRDPVEPHEPREPLELELERVRVEGGFFGVHADMPIGQLALRDVDVGSSTLRRLDIADIVEPCAIRLNVVALDAARLRARGYGETGLLLTVPMPLRPRDDVVSVEDLSVEAPISRLPLSVDRCLVPLGFDDVPAVSVSLGVARRAKLARVAVVEAETIGFIVSTEPGAELALTDVALEEVRCRGLELRGLGRLHVERMRAHRRPWPRQQLTADELLNVTESAQLTAEDIDAEVGIGAARALLRVNDLGAVTLERWRARRVTTLLFNDFMVKPIDLRDRFIERYVRDGVLEDADRVTSLSPLGCDDVAARPPFLRVRVPKGLRVFDNCP